MTPRERVRAALDHREPDRVPVALGGSAQHLAEHRYVVLRDHFAVKDLPRRPLVGFYTTPDYNPVLDQLETDIRYLHIRPPQDFIQNSLLEKDQFTEFTDEWGLTHRFSTGYYELAGMPLAANFTKEGIESFPWPDAYDPVRVEGVADEVKYLYEQTNFALALHRPVYGNLWEMAKLLLGMEKALMATLLEPAMLERLFWKLAEVQYGFYDVMLEIVGPYIEYVEIAEDLGTNLGPIFSPTFYRDVMKPVHIDFIKRIKAKSPGVRVLLHNDGAIREFLPDLIEAGFDILNPIESHLPGMDPVALKRDFGDALVFQGGVNVKEILPKGTEDEIRAEVRRRIEEMGPGGGYILGPTHNLSNDIPLKNILAFFKAGLELGTYPI
jgi:uroporphyrinogen decarboxylase